MRYRSGALVIWSAAFGALAPGATLFAQPLGDTVLTGPVRTFAVSGCGRAYFAIQGPFDLAACVRGTGTTGHYVLNGGQTYVAALLDLTVERVNGFPSAIGGLDAGRALFQFLRTDGTTGTGIFDPPVGLPTTDRFVEADSSRRYAGGRVLAGPPQGAPLLASDVVPGSVVLTTGNMIFTYRYSDAAVVDYMNIALTFMPVPEPSTLALGAAGLAAVGAVARGKRRTR